MEAEEPAVPDLVSVVIPTYNRAYIVGKAIHSILRQTYHHIEVVVVDDGSTDETRQVVESFGEPVRYLYKPNGGVTAARNFGLRHVRGEFVGLLDSDDQWLPWKVEAQVRLLRAFPDLGMVWTDMAAVDDAGKVTAPAFIRTYYTNHRRSPIERVMASATPLDSAWPDAPAEVAGRPFYKGDIFPQMLLGNLVHTSTVLLRRDRLRRVGSFDESLLKSGEDYEFHLHTCYHGPVGFLDAPAITYRFGSADQLTGPTPRPENLYLARNTLRTVQKWLDRGRDRVTLAPDVVRRRVADCYGALAEEELLAGHWRAGQANLARSLRMWPGQPRRAAVFLSHFLPGPLRRALRWVVRAGATANPPAQFPSTSLPQHS
jgi:GT2 family glycosyltransferase